MTSNERPKTIRDQDSSPYRSPHLVEMPLDPRHSPIPIRRHRLKQARTAIHILIRTSLTRIYDFRRGVGAGSRIDECDGFSAFGIGVGVGAIGHHLDGEGNNCLAVGIGGAAGAESDVVVGYVACVGGGSF